jgi:hypothetical protein
MQLSFSPPHCSQAGGTAQAGDPIVGKWKRPNGIIVSLLALRRAASALQT